MFEFECEGKNGINKLSLTTSDFEKFSKAMTLITKLYQDEEKVKPVFYIAQYMTGNTRCAMHCNTKEKANIFYKYLNDMRLKWNSGKSYLDNEDNEWNYYKENTCYDFYRGGYSPKDYYEDNGYKILEFDDFDWSDWEGLNKA